uniref:EGF-like domain-containing protein n=1 Tax=Haemonchus contortus TaxID=6289 RepID=A0A7I4Y6B4_HAECO
MVLREILLFPALLCYKVVVNEDHLGFGSYNTPATETVRYVPLGHHAAFKCGAIEKSIISERSKNATWWLMRKIKGKWNTYELMDSEGFEGVRMFASGNTAYLYGMSTILDGSILSCSVYIENLQTNESSPSKTSTMSSRISLVAQNCGKNSEDSSTSMNLLNPCRFGSCVVTNDGGFEMLKCRCMPQYTGLFCDKLVSSATLHELLFYSPIAALIFVLLIVACCFDYVEGIRKEKPMLLEKHIPRGDLSVDLQKNYPAMFITPEQYAEMAFAIQQEISSAASSRNRSRRRSAERTRREITSEKSRSRSAPRTAPTPESERSTVEAPKTVKPLPQLLTPPGSVDKTDGSPSKKMDYD